MDFVEHIFDVSLSEFFECLSTSRKFRNDIINIFKNNKYNNCLWEFPPITSSTLNDKASFVIIPTSKFPSADPSSFNDKFNVTKSTKFVIFDNISGDTKLISPVPSTKKENNNEFCGHIMNFMKYCDDDQKHDLLKMLGDHVKNIMSLSIKQSIYVSTHGHGIPWLHIRISTHPKYYVYKKYTN